MSVFRRRLPGVEGEGMVIRVPTMVGHVPKKVVDRNAERRPERVAVDVNGHRTRSMLDRYNVTSEKDLIEAMAKRAAYEKTLPKADAASKGNRRRLEELETRRLRLAAVTTETMEDNAAS